MDYPLRFRATGAVEEMDRANADPTMLTRTYDQFPLINSVVSGWRSVYRERIRPHLSPTSASTLLDVGCGGGDLARALAHWAQRDGLSLAITGIDPDSRAYDYAVSRPAPPGVTFRAAFSSELVSEGQQYDFVISNHILHHLSAAELQGLLSDSEALTTKTAIHSDIVRSPIAYALFSVGTLPFFPGSFIRRDGLTSIRRSYKPAELAAVVPTPWTVEPRAPWVNLLCLDRHEP
ncbi:class I SAM-dependent methyltransferase [Arthrobacter roseus]|uniref:class I SAM-dependent methyltransferase n=1 Tax=Arthrobacter roseus TaxID=136274 RepID=UPI001963FEFB|nr:class I SAM-dependent methyltransferase [Arthrobacter roseus]MBM7847784.1 2-polyprenyl-3-methyl-5-hydroxy-6-metoxy-1,4-benzoquinol methylase [Arthrobacter roseus]